MTKQSYYVLEHFPVRKSRKQKAAFREWLTSELTAAGYETRVEKARGLVTSHNVAAGDPDGAQVIFTAHYDTCAALPVPNFITPCNPVAFLGYQLLLAAVLLLIPVVVSALLTLGGLAAELAFPAFYVLLLGELWCMMAGPANRSNVNDNTSGVITLLEIALSLTPEQREKAAFVFFDNEELGLFGSSAFRSRHKKTMKADLLINFDCVSDGDHLLFFPKRQVKKNGGIRRLERAYLPMGDKQVKVVRGFGIYPSDQKNFPTGVGVAALHRKPLLGYCLGRIHTWRDTVLMEENIELLRRGSIRLLEQE